MTHIWLPRNPWRKISCGRVSENNTPLSSFSFVAFHILNLVSFLSKPSRPRDGNKARHSKYKLCENRIWKTKSFKVCTTIYNFIIRLFWLRFFNLKTWIDNYSYNGSKRNLLKKLRTKNKNEKKITNEMKRREVTVSFIFTSCSWYQRQWNLHQCHRIETIVLSKGCKQIQPSLLPEPNQWNGNEQALLNMSRGKNIYSYGWI